LRCLQVTEKEKATNALQIAVSAKTLPSEDGKKLFAAGSAFCGLQRVNPNFNDVNFRFGVGGKVANAQAPFCSGVCVGVTKFTAVRLNDAITPFTLFDNREKRAFAEFCRITCLHMPTPEKI
jgi:hypothetical protein